VAQVCQGALDAVVAPGRVFACQFHDQFDDLWRCQRPTGLALPLVAVVPFLSDKLAMPAQDRVGRDDGGQLFEELAA
jgi:hypothetical protein